MSDFELKLRLRVLEAVVLAAAYSFGIARNHPFVDGNKRVAFTIGTLFLELNGYKLTASEANAAITFEHLAAGNIKEEKLGLWFKEQSTTIRC